MPFGGVIIGLLLTCGPIIGLACGPHRHEKAPGPLEQQPGGWQALAASSAPSARLSNAPESPAATKPSPTRGITILASDIGNKYSVAALDALVDAGEFRPIIVDWAWITHHWEQTDFAAVATFVNSLKRRNIEVMAMYRPRFLDTPTVPVQVKVDGTPASDHGSEIRFSSPEARAWGIRWGTEILKRCPGFGEIIIYNPRNVDQSPEAVTANRGDPAAAYRAVAQFLAEAGEQWRAVKPDVKVGVVYMNDPAFWSAVLDSIDVAHPYLFIKEDIDIGSDTFEMTRLAPVVGNKMGVNLAKVTWGETDKVPPAMLQDFTGHARQYGFSYVLWTFDTLFDSPLYEPRAVAQSMGLDFDKLEPALKKLGVPASSRTPLVSVRTAVQGKNSPRDWVYFTSKENPNGVPPHIVAQFESGESIVPIAEDVVILAHRTDIAWGSHPDLSISLGDSDRVLMRFSTVVPRHSESLRRADLVLDMRLSKIPPAEPFAMGVYRVLDRWAERSTRWDNQPSFEPEPVATAEIKPREGTVRVDVTDLVLSWLDGSPNRGILLRVSEPLTSPDQTVAQQTQTTPPQLSLPPSLPCDPLPWPHEAPGLSEAERHALVEDVWIINDFSLYQGDDTMAYYHAGLDIVVDNGTPIYAMKDGWVKSVAHGAVALADEKGAEPAFGWNYVHLGNIQVAVGQFLVRGMQIGQVQFDGLPHIHLEKVYSQDPYWGDWQYTLMPNAHFTYPDDDPPVIETPFYFFRNESDEFLGSKAGGKPTLRGDVDIVVAMREQGLYAHSRENGFGDRLGIAKVAYTIRSQDTGAEVHCASFDFEHMAIKKSTMNRAFNTDMTRIAYKHPRLFGPDTTHGNKDLEYYIITNSPPDKQARELDAAHTKYCWRTTDSPDGDYELTVHATDARAHAATASMKVAVRNGR